MTDKAKPSTIWYILIERVLAPQERPLQLQKKLLEQAGYTESDRLEDLGREDNSYLVRFTFREAAVPRFDVRLSDCS